MYSPILLTFSTKDFHLLRLVSTNQGYKIYLVYTEWNDAPMFNNIYTIFKSQKYKLKLKKKMFNYNKLLYLVLEYRSSMMF